MTDQYIPDHQPRSRLDRKTRWAFIVLALIAGLYLLTEYRGPLLQALPILLVLACPLLCLYYMRRRPGQNGTQRKNREDKR